MYTRKKYSITLDSEIRVQGIRIGNQQGEKCIILGSGTVYIECIPKLLKDRMEFITTNMYWNINTNASDQYIQNLTIPLILIDLRQVQQKLRIDKIYVLGAYYDFSKIKNTTTPSINLIGLGHGLADFSFTTDYIKKYSLKNIDYYIFAKSKHNPFLDQPTETADIVLKWIDEQTESTDKKVYFQAKL